MISWSAFSAIEATTVLYVAFVAVCTLLMVIIMLAITFQHQLPYCFKSLCAMDHVRPAPA